MNIQSIGTPQSAKIPTTFRAVPGLDEKECDLLKSVARRVQITDGELLFEEGEHSHNIYFITSGQIALGRRHRETACIELGAYGFVDLADCDQDCENCWVHKTTLQAGGCVGEMATLDGKPHSFTAKGVGRVELLEVNTRQIKALLESHPNIRRCLRQALPRS
ncbi:MAG: cyclic nucleotide-binding domain-containing protein [Magnetococcales bacterium]|nr:cyclic nucleotide-binding domain-containing protein [Magnetococcales bacterium]NGZ27768.1 cyclic nucleotide-binding domain-containing protein [Magnetococcales bacterium]